jgi:hypothetical protein
VEAEGPNDERLRWRFREPLGSGERAAVRRRSPPGYLRANPWGTNRPGGAQRLKSQSDPPPGASGERLATLPPAALPVCHGKLPGVGEDPSAAAMW